jgi:hypothetical protein
MEDGGKQAFYGVGAVRGIKNRPLAVATADNRARAEIARTLKVYSASLMKDYMASTNAGGDAAAEEQHVEQAIKTFAAATLTGVNIIEHWYAPDGTVYALARIDLEHVRESLAKTEAFSQAQRDYADQRAAEQHQAMEPPAEPPPPPAEPEFCSLELKVQQIGRSHDDCYVDVKVARRTGTLSYPCAGGDAKVDFGTVTFAGTVQSDAVELNLETVYEYQPIDHCKWKSVQRMSGQLGKGRLHFDYTEAPLPNQKSCAQPCTADGDVLIRKRSAPKAATPPPT